MGSQQSEMSVYSKQRMNKISNLLDGRNDFPTIDIMKG